MPHLKHCACLVIGGLALGAPAGASAAGPEAPGPTATVAATCDISGQERRLGATYVTRLTTRGVSCRTAKALVRDFHRCRRRNGGADGRCSRVNRYRCSERRTTAPTQFDSRTTCRRGTRRVSFTYTQNT